MDEVDDLVLTPFRDIVEKAKHAVHNAGSDNPVMVKAAQTLIKEGERGLKRIEPLCSKHLDEYGPNFIAALKDNDEIANYRNDLTDLLWDFDDYTDLDSFEADKFGELQTLSRKAAPRIYDILMRMKLEAPFRDDLSSRGSFAQLSTPTSPSMNPLIAQRRSGSGSYLDGRGVEDATAQLRGLMRGISGDGSSDPGYDSGELPPKPPLTNPWDWNLKPGVEGRSIDDGHDRVIVMTDESPVLPAAGFSHEVKVAVIHPPPPSIPSGRSLDPLEDQRLSVSSGGSSSGGSQRSYSQSHLARPKVPALSTYSIPEDSAPAHGPVSSDFRLGQSRKFHSTVSLDSESGPINDAASDLVSPMTVQEPHLPAMAPPPRPRAQTVPDEQPGLEVVQHTPEQLAEMDCAPIPVESEQEKKTETQGSSNLASKLPPQDCTIDATSSFALSKGFCEGASEVVRGGIGIKRTKKPVGFASSSTIARCLHCLYELDFAEIEADVNRTERGNFTRNGINFRVRFLQKSHIATKRVDDVQYACVFCQSSGHTIDRSDSTVFFNQKALFEHLARHPQPLPNVTGLVVIHGPEMPEKHKNDYDIHFKSSPQRHPCIERRDEIIQMPTGTSRDQARRMYGQMLLYDRSPALELAQGAKVTGISWPIQYQGEWCFGWHDGVWASVPTDLIKLDPPPQNMIKYDRGSLLRGKARWKFAVKEKEKDKDGVNWLRFDKNEVISNISFVDAEHWCWTGTNAKGRTGIFPQAYIDTSQLQEHSTPASARAYSLSEEKNRSLSVFGKFGMRKTSSARPPSIAGSTSSHETAVTTGTSNKSRKW